MKKIIYIEDNSDTAKAVKMILERAGFKTEIAYTGEEAIEMILKNHFDLTIIDIMLPDMSGWMVLNKLKEKKVKSSYMFLSALPLPKSRLAELKNMGVSDYVEKPFKKEDLIDRVKKVLK